uniref:Ovule protein n=1 Tax=Meloidogyne incognita TaxID=6306 RepID=A0A914NXN4_MELIC
MNYLFQIKFHDFTIDFFLQVRNHYNPLLCLTDVHQIFSPHSLPYHSLPHLHIQVELF